MKTLQEIRKLTQDAIIQRKEKSKERAKKASQIALDKKRQQLKEDMEKAMETATKWFPEEIEEAARKGKKSYNIDLSIYNEEGTLSRRVKLEVKYIKKFLKDFNPVFTDINRVGIQYDYEGEAIGENHYKALNVAFSW